MSTKPQLCGSAAARVLPLVSCPHLQAISGPHGKATGVSALGQAPVCLPARPESLLLCSPGFALSGLRHKQSSQQVGCPKGQLSGKVTEKEEPL